MPFIPNINRGPLMFKRVVQNNFAGHLGTATVAQKGMPLFLHVSDLWWPYGEREAEVRGPLEMSLLTYDRMPSEEHP